MHAAETLDHLRSRAEHQVVGIREDDLRSAECCVLSAEALQLVCRQRLHRSRCPDRHKYWGVDHAVGRGDFPESGGAVRVKEIES
jgi:hypothetical protein